MDKLLTRVRPYFNFFINNLMPRWIIFVIDLGIVAITFIALWWFRKKTATLKMVTHLKNVYGQLILYPNSKINELKNIKSNHLNYCYATSN